MEKKITENRKRTNGGIGFGFLYQIFKAKVILHFFLVVTFVMFSSYLSWTNNEIFNEKRALHNVSHSCGSSCSQHQHPIIPQKDNINDESSSHDNSSATESSEEYGNYLPFWNYWKKSHSSSKTVGRGQFVVITLSLLSFYLLSNYFSSLLEKDIATESYFRLKSMLLEKLWKLGLEQKKNVTYELKALLENEIEVVSELWEHLPAHFFQSASTILIFSAERLIRLKDAGRSSLVFFFVLNLVFVVVYGRVLNYSAAKYEAYKKIATEELAVVDKQISSAQLIENMGLTSFYEDLRNRHAGKTLFSEKEFGRSMSFLTIIVSFLPEYYRYLSLLFAGKLPLGAALGNIIPFFLIFDALRDIFDCFKEYGKYRLACSKIDSFLDLEEREENLEKRSIVGLKVEEILLANIDFKYDSSEQLVLENYSRKLSKGSINKIIGGNGTGKTTILYLILGIIKPLKGEVLIKFSTGEVMNLHEEVNLYEWREKITVYLSHDNLVENGSTGQKQLENISKTLDQRKSSQIFIFDESANALDSEKQNFVAEELGKIIDEGKIVILVQHKTNLDNDSN